ncbi:MAG: hypothetical protein ACRCSG_05570, partial [Cellulosilyticaceae bacterium]
MSDSTIQISQADGDKLFGVEPVIEQAPVIETTQEIPIIEANIVDNGVVVQNDNPIVEESDSIVESNIVEAIVEDTQIIIQNEEIKPVEVEKTTKTKVKLYKDNFQAALNKYYNTVENPDVESFARAYKANFDGLSATEILRLDIINDPYNKGLDKETIDYLLDEKLAKYDLDTDDERELKRNQQLLQREANIVKDKMIESSKKFVAEFESELDIEVDAPVQQEQIKQTE